MDSRVLLLLAGVVVATSAWSIPYHNVPRPLRVTRYAPPPPHYRIPVRPVQPQPEEPLEPQWERPKRQHDYHHDDDHYGHNHHGHDNHGHDNHGHDHHGSSGVTGPVHTFVKTDKNANYKWGVRHHVGNKFAS